MLKRKAAELQPHGHEEMPKVHSLVPSQSRITDARERALLVDTYRSMWLLPESVQHFAAPSPISLERGTMPRVLVPGTMCSLKCDGVRYLLMLTTMHGENIAVMMDRAMNMFEIEVWAQEDFFTQGSLFDGELVWEYVNYAPKVCSHRNPATIPPTQMGTPEDKRNIWQMRFVVFDVMRCAGQSFLREAYPSRLQRVTTVLHTDGVDEANEQMLLEERLVAAGPHAHDLRLIPKRCMPIWDVEKLWQRRNECFYKSDGIIFMIHNMPVGINTYEGCYKWKSAHTVDVLVSSGAVWSAWAQAGSSQCELQRVSTAGMEWEVELQANSVLEDGAIVECDCELRAGRAYLFPLKRRIDKESPNTVETIARTLKNVHESITIEDLCAQCEQLKSCAYP